MQHAIGIAATQVNGLREMFGSHTKSFHPGRAAQSGLIAAVLASNGYTSSLQGLEAKRGWVSVVSVENNLDAHIQSLGRVWEITKNAYKPFPCGIVVHPIIDGCIQLHEQFQAKGENISSIRSVHLRVHPLVLELTGKETPQDGLQAKFSVFHRCRRTLSGQSRAGPPTLKLVALRRALGWAPGCYLTSSCLKIRPRRPWDENAYFEWPSLS